MVRVLGHRLFHTSLGKPDRGTVLVLHGGPGFDHTYLLSHFDLAPRGYRVVLYDQLGCGASDRPREPALYRFERAAEEVEGLRRALGLGRVHLLGHSYGAALALEAVDRYPHHYRSLILASGLVSNGAVFDRAWEERVRSLPPVARAYFRRRNGKLEDRWSRTRLGGFRGFSRGYAPYARGHIFRGEVAPWELAITDNGLNTWLNPITWNSMRNWLGSGEEYDPSHGMSRIRMPCLITAGRFDHIPMEVHRFAHRRIRGSKLVVFEKSSHMPHFEERDRYMRTLADFLDTVG
jgi:proline iminopeptidase